MKGSGSTLVANKVHQWLIKGSGSTLVADKVLSNVKDICLVIDDALSDGSK